jgi:hypothetical protein
MNILKYFIISISCLSITILNGQAKLDNTILQPLQEEETIFAHQYFNPYPTNQLQFFGNWGKGIITFTNGKKSVISLLRYNSWLDELAWLREDDYAIGLVVKESVAEFTIGGIDGTPSRRYVKILMPELAGLQKTLTFLQILSDGQTRLFCHQKTKLTKHTGAMSQKKYYYLDYQGKLIKFSPSRFSLIHLLNNQDAEKMKTIIHQNHLHVRHEADLARAVDLFNL